jgi:hypothetical protein
VYVRARHYTLADAAPNSDADAATNTGADTAMLGALLLRFRLWLLYAAKVSYTKLGVHSHGAGHLLLYASSTDVANCCSDYARATANSTSADGRAAACRVSVVIRVEIKIAVSFNESV